MAHEACHFGGGRGLDKYSFHLGRVFGASIKTQHKEHPKSRRVEEQKRTNLERNVRKIKNKKSENKRDRERERDKGRK